MSIFSDLWTAIAGVFSRTNPNDTEPDPGASATLELSRTDIEIIESGDITLT